MAQQSVSVPLVGQQIPIAQHVVSGGRSVSRPLLDSVTVEAEAATVVSLRPPQYGLPLAQRLAFLRQLVPNNGSTYVGLFAVMPARTGVGGTECSGSSYARVLHQAWRDVVVAEFIARRANVGEIRLPQLTGDLEAAGWGIWSASTGGTLLAFGLTRQANGQATVFEFATDDTPRFISGELQFGIQ
jgi:hypothetical protein